MINAGKYNKLISFYQPESLEDKDGFKNKVDLQSIAKYFVKKKWAEVKTTAGLTLLVNNTDFEKATTKFTIRYDCEINRKMIIAYNNKLFSIEYLNNIDEANIELEIQAKEVMK